MEVIRIVLLKAAGFVVVMNIIMNICHYANFYYLVAKVEYCNIYHLVTFLECRLNSCFLPCLYQAENFLVLDATEFHLVHDFYAEIQTGSFSSVHMSVCLSVHLFVIDGLITQK